jgi:hypothetical protein
MRVDFGLAGSAQKFFSYSAGRKRFGFFAQAFRFLSKTAFKGLGLFETTMRHDATSVLTGPNRRVQHTERNMPMPGLVFKIGHRTNGPPLTTPF